MQHAERGMQPSAPIEGSAAAGAAIVNDKNKIAARESVRVSIDLPPRIALSV
jgi:hypothetical protein